MGINEERKMDMCIEKFTNICGGVPNEALSPFQEYVLWLRTKYLLYKYKIVDNNALFEYEQELIADLREENGNEFFWIERCT